MIINQVPKENRATGDSQTGHLLWFKEIRSPHSLHSFENIAVPRC